MALEALSSSELPSFIIYDTIPASTETIFLLENSLNPPHQDQDGATLMDQSTHTLTSRKALAVQGRKKRKRKPRVCKNKEEAETQRMTHIAVERNRRKQMNEYLAVLRSLMPESYVQRVCVLCVLSLSLPPLTVQAKTRR